MNITRNLTVVYMVYCLLLITATAVAQSRPPVLVLHGNNKYITYFNTQNDLTAHLIKQGIVDQATVEFWVKKPLNKSLASPKKREGKWLYSNLKEGEKEFSLAGEKGILQLKMGNILKSIVLNQDENFWDDQWHHIAISFKASSLKLYVDGNRKAEFPFLNSSFQLGNMFFTETNDNELHIAEYRGWSKLRTAQQIRENRLLTYSQNQNNLERLNSNGLVVAYADKNYVEKQVFILPIKQITWDNMIKSAINTSIPKAAKVTSSINIEGEKKLTLAELRTNVDHPIYSLKDVLLQASDGSGKNAAGKAIIKLKWPHISGAKSYIISRRNLSDSFSNFTHIKTHKPASNTTVSSYLSFEDGSILPNELYQYQVIAEGVEGSKPGLDNGFVFANGVVKGKIGTPKNIASQNVLVKATPEKDSKIPGNSLLFTKESTPIIFNEVSLFEELNNQGTIEFWYRTPNTKSATNTIFKFSEMEIRMTEEEVQLFSKDSKTDNKSTLFMSAPRTNDTNWHHYALTFGADGGAIFIDGGKKLPAGEEKPFTWHGASQTSFEVNLNTVSRYSLNSLIQNRYELDELRIWKVKKPVEEIHKYWNIILGDNALPNLEAYYRFDIGDKHNIYNQAAQTLGRYKGISFKEISFTEKQPFTKEIKTNVSVKTPLTYGVYTNTDGRYRFNSINSGRQNSEQANNYLTYRITPTKPNNEFTPVSDIRNIPRTLALKEPEQTNFTNISSYEITGKVLYVIKDPGKTENKMFPTVQNTAILLDGKEVTSTEVGSLVRTNNEGIFGISGDPGRHRISVGQPKLETSSIAIDRISLDFKSKGYAVSKANIANAADQGFTWTGFIKPDVDIPTVDSNGESAIPAKQTILHWGAIQLELRNNNELVLKSKGADLLSKTIEGNSQYNFFGITKDVENNVIGLWVNDNYQTHPYTREAIDSKLYLGASYVSPTEMSNHAIANIDFIEYRNSHYTSQELNEIKNGNVLAKDKESLKLTYNFEHTHGTRAVNLATGTGTTNNYLSLHEGAYFNDKSNANYIRKFAFEYKAFESGDAVALVNPKNTKEYLFNLTEPTANINFENITRRSFVGNIVIPCNNNVGNWTGKIIRTDVQYPKYERTIKASNFNDENNLFTVHDLLPGHYRVHIKREGTNDEVRSSIIDLRTSNKSYDFQYRNDLEIDLALYTVTKEELETLTSMDELANKRIDPTCGADQSIYKLESGKNILAIVSVYEDYNGSKCPVENATVHLSGDLIIAPTNGKTEGIGKKSFLTFVGSPNFVGDYLRTMAIVVSHNNRTKTVTKKAYVTGSRRGNQDFTLKDPTVGFILYDPPGDTSSATLSRGATYSFSKSTGGGLDVNTASDISIGTDAETSMISMAITTALGVGAGQGIIYTTVDSESKFTGKIDANFTYRHTEQNSTSVSLEQSISTSSDENYVGADADIFIGSSRVLTFGTGKTLLIDSNCKPVIDTDTKIMTADKLTPFVYTRQEINDNIIRGLQEQLIKRHDLLIPIKEEEKEKRNSLDLQATIDGFKIDTNNPETDKALVDFIFQIEQWKRIIKRKTKEERLAYINEQTKKLGNTTADLKEVGSDLGSSITKLDSEISFSALTSTTYTLTRGRESSTQDSGGSTFGGGTSINNSTNLFGISFSIITDIKTLGVVESSDTNTNTSGRIDSFTLSDNDPGDHFNVRIGRDKIYDTPFFYTVAGKSMCPFESGTVPREGVEITVDSAVKYGTGDESILYNLTLRNTQIANDATRKKYKVGINAASNSKGAEVFLNASPIFEPTTASEINFDLDGNSPTGVVQEIKAELRIKRGMDSPEEISYENIGIQMYSICEQKDEEYRSYRVDEYNEVGVVPFHEIFVTAHFKGACVSEIEPELPTNNWVVNNTNENKLEFRFRIPEVINKQVDEKFSVALEYALPGNNEAFELEKMSLTELYENMDKNTGFISYTADVSKLADGEYRFRIAPVCDDGGANLPPSRKNPTPYVEGRIARLPPEIISTNPVNGGVLSQGYITAEFNRAINSATAVNTSFSLRGILGGVPEDLISAAFDNVNDEVIIPHKPVFNLKNNTPFTIEAWIQPSSLPDGFTTVPILRKSTNFSIALNSAGKIVVNDVVQSEKSLSPFNWTHVSIVYDGLKTVTIYYNGDYVGSGHLSNLVINEDPIEIAKAENGKSFTGKLDEVRIWTTQRSPLEIVSKMDKQLIGNESNLVAYFVFNDNALEGTNGAPDEAIRDFTGNASGTTAKGLSFVSGISEAAPLDITKIAKDLQFTVITSANNTKVHLVPVFGASFVEGARLTAMVLDKRLEDPSQNKIGGKSWSFVVNQNTIHWSQNNLIINQEQGKETKISSIDLNNSKGGTAVKYRFKQLPSWLKVSKRGVPIEKDSYQSLAAGFIERELDFTIAPYLNPGIHSANVYIEVFQIGENKETPIGIEAFHLEVNVTCPAPNFAENFNINDFLGQMTITGNLFFDQKQSKDTQDIVVAYFNGEYRGQANVEANGLVNLSISGNPSEFGALSFSVWDASKCMEYKQIEEKYSYSLRSNIGSIANPVRFTVGKRIAKRIVLVKGYQELSFNVRDNDSGMKLSLSSIKGLEAGDEIRDIENFSLVARVARDGSFITTSEKIKSLDIRKAYILKSSSSKLMSVEGVLVPLNTNIKIEANKTVGIPYFPNNLRTIQIALNSLNSTTVSIGDKIKRRGLKAEYSKNGWQGSLTHLTPGLGYLYEAAKEGILNYAGIPNIPILITEEEPLDISEDYIKEASKINWKVDRNAYLNFMYLTAKIGSVDIDVNKEYTIGAFVNGEVRGIAKPLFIDGEYKYFMGIGGDEGEAVSFKLYDGEKIIDLDNHLSFIKEESLGNIESPYTLLYSNKLRGSILEDKNYILEQNIYNQTKGYGTLVFQVPNDQFVEVSLYNVVGQKIQTLFSKKVKGKIKHSLKLRKENLNLSLRSGVYFFRLKTKDKIVTKQMIIE
ncbi:LamG-like jellyroll fold domain-containing protein [Tenacibaculum sp. C7A-26P2]|uniref:LamG-like jellyroll fold domain-containing protein n=1 Tax=Tenacibaculum sp. C7A-26P2 TaxID=3447504 RepID=UPI003F84DA40